MELLVDQPSTTEDLISAVIETADSRLKSELLSQLTRYYRTNPWTQTIDYDIYTVHFLDDDFNPLPNFFITYPCKSKQCKFLLN